MLRSLKARRTAPVGNKSWCRCLCHIVRHTWRHAPGPDASRNNERGTVLPDSDDSTPRPSSCSHARPLPPRRTLPQPPQFSARLQLLRGSHPWCNRLLTAIRLVPRGVCARACVRHAWGDGSEAGQLRLWYGQLARPEIGAQVRSEELAWQGRGCLRSRLRRQLRTLGRSMGLWQNRGWAPEPSLEGSPCGDDRGPMMGRRVTHTQGAPPMIPWTRLAPP